jgi:transketolase
MPSQTAGTQTETGTDQKTLWANLAAQLRVDSIRCTTAAASGHPTSSMSAADIMAVLLTSHLRYDFDNPKHPNNDSLIFSKGHACPLLYSAYKAAGAVSDEELLTLRQLGSRLEGHPTPDIPWVEAATGSLGQGLPVGIGDALAGKFLDKLPYRVWVILGDSEMAEGSVWEAFAIADHYKLNNVVAIIDVNRLGQRGPTMLEWHTEVYAARARAFGWNAIVIDGHNLDEIERAFQEAESSDKPTCIVARTLKGAGASLTADQSDWHGKGLKPEQAEEAIAEIKQKAGLEGDLNLVVQVQKPEDLQPQETSAGEIQLPQYTLGEKVACRKAYGDALKAIGADPMVVAIDGEVSNSTYSDIFKKAFPDRFFEVFIAEQLMVSVACGLQHRRRKPFCSTFAAFYSRAYDQIRMGAISQANMKLCGSHAGVSIGEDGPSQMALEDIAMMRAVFGSTVLYPSDATSTAVLVGQMKDLKGISFIRTTREATPVLYEASEQFPIGGSKTLRQSDNDVATVIGAGITLHEALKAAQQLQGENTNIRVIDLYSVKPIDVAAIAKAARETRHIVVVEDHWREGGLGDAVLAALAEAHAGNQLDGDAARYTHLAVSKMPRSGKPMELLEDNGISAKDIVAAVKSAQ